MRKKEDAYLLLLQAQSTRAVRQKSHLLSQFQGRGIISRKPGFSKKAREHSQKRLVIQGMF